MLPEFNKYGNLPAGIYKSSITCIENKFGKSSKERISLFKDFHNFIELIAPFKANIKHLILDGSFVTSKETPGDTDCIMLIKNNTSFPPETVANLVSSKKLYNMDLFIREERNIEKYKNILYFFSKNRDLKSKGVIEVILWLKTKDNINIHVQNFKTSR